MKQLIDDANSGDAEAQASLGLCFSLGDGIEQDYEQAIGWWQKAADQGLNAAQIVLGFCYYYGLGVPQDNKLAYMWLDLGLDSSTADAALKDLGQKRLEKLERKMTKEQIAESKEMATDWLKTH